MTEIDDDYGQDFSSKRTVVIAGHKTSISLEDAFWTAARAIATQKGLTVGGLISQIDQMRGKNNLSSQVRLYVLAHYKALAENA